MADESRRSTAAQFFMDEETKHNESVSTYDKVNRRSTKFYHLQYFSLIFNSPKM